MAARLRGGLKHTPIASVRPIVSDELKAYGLRTDILSRQRCQLHEAADLGDGGDARQDRTARRGHFARSEAIQTLDEWPNGLLRRFAPRNDDYSAACFDSLKYAR
jgi:hypothetical protein